jgi:hypothetical protein
MKIAGTRLAAVSALTIAVSGGVATAATASAAPMTVSATRSAVHVAQPTNIAQRAHAGQVGHGMPMTQPLHATRQGPAHSGPGGPGGHGGPGGPGRHPRIRVVVLDCQGNPQIRPRRFIITCADANTSLAKLRWFTWGPTTALGRGVEWVNNCTPNCAHGRLLHRNVKVLFWRVKPAPRHQFRFTRLTAGHQTYNL